MGSGLSARQLTVGAVVTDRLAELLFGERVRHPYANRIEWERLNDGRLLGAGPA